jgi:hypothetical protein
MLKIIALLFYYCSFCTLIGLMLPGVNTNILLKYTWILILAFVILFSFKKNKMDKKSTEFLSEKAALNNITYEEQELLKSYINEWFESLPEDKKRKIEHDIETGILEEISISLKSY